MSETITRRGALLTATAAAILSGNRIAAGSPNAQDRELSRMGAKLEAALADEQAAIGRYSDQQKLWFATRRSNEDPEPAEIAEADAEARAAFDKCSSIAAAMLQTPAMTFAGVMVKLRLRHFYFDAGDDGDELLESLTADLRRLLDGTATASV